MPVLCRRSSCRHRPIASEPAEVVNAHHVVEATRCLYATLPPGVAVGRHPGVVVEGIAPQLTVLAEVVGRHARHPGRIVALVQLIVFWMGPHVSRVQRHVDGHVAKDAHATLMRIGAQGVPLPEEQVLHVGEQPHVAVQLERIATTRVLPVQANVLVGPHVPRNHAKVALYGHEQRVVVEPVGVLLGKHLHAFLVT